MQKWNNSTQSHTILRQHDRKHSSIILTVYSPRDPLHGVIK